MHKKVGREEWTGFATTILTAVVSVPSLCINFELIHFIHNLRET